jgi:hypothetical protein
MRTVMLAPPKRPLKQISSLPMLNCPVAFQLRFRTI